MVDCELGQQGAGKSVTTRAPQRRTPYEREPPKSVRHDIEASFNIPSSSDRAGDSGDAEWPEVPQFSLKVAGNDDCKAVGIKIADAIRSGKPPALLTIGNPSINTSVKSIAVARQHLQDTNVDLTFQPAFRDADRTRALIAFYIMVTDRTSTREDEDELELSVASHSKPPVVAGAIAARIREKKAVRLAAIGVDAVAAAVLAIGNARCYLEDDNLDVRVMPEFYHELKNNKQINVMKLHLLAEKMDE